MRTGTLHFAWTLAGAVVVMTTWHLAALQLPSIILPSPSDTGVATGRLLLDPRTLGFMAESLGTFLLGFVISCCVGFVLGVAIGLSSRVTSAVSPVMVLLNAVPTVAWMGIAMMWFGLEMGPTVFLIVVTTLPILVTSVSRAISVDRSRFDDVANVYGINRQSRLRYLTLPPLKTSTVAAIMAMAALGWKITIMGEFLTASRGLGSLLVEAKAHLQTDRVFAVTFLLVLMWGIMSLILNLLSRIAHRRPTTHIAEPAPNRHSRQKAVSDDSTKTTAPGIECRSVKLGHVDRVIAQDLTFSVRPGTVTAILGPSGVGKTTLLRAMSGLELPIAGEISQHHGATAYVFQDDRLVPWLTVADNLALTSGCTAERIAQQLEVLGLEGSQDFLVDELSGGMAKRVALARGFLHGAAVILLDEPFSGLDPLRRLSLIDDIEMLRVTDQQTIVFVTHDVDDALLLADQALVLRGSPATIHTRCDLSNVPRPRTLNTAGLITARQELFRALTTPTINSTSNGAPQQHAGAALVSAERKTV